VLPASLHVIAMKVFALVALLVVLCACADAAVTLTSNGGTPTGVLVNSLRITDVTQTVTITAACSGPETCDGTGWVTTPAIGTAGFSGVSISAGTPGLILTIDPVTFARAGYPKFTAQFNPNPVSANRSVEVFVFDGLYYDSAAYAAGIAGYWVATKVDATARLAQLPPGNAVTDFVGAPLSFRDGTPTPPLYWGNSYEIRVGLVNDDDEYCGSSGSWPANFNDADAAPTLNIDTAGCPHYLEEGDRWTFPAPSQRIPNAANGGYNTATGQSSAPNDYSTPLTWTVRGEAGSTLTFDGLANDDADWESSCVPPMNSEIFPSWPCIKARYNPDPKVWIVTADGNQGLPRVSAIGTSRVTAPVVNPSYQGTPRVLIGQLAQTNDFNINFEWGFQATGAASAGVPALTAVTNVPRCAPVTAFVPNLIAPVDGVDRDYLGVGRTATCKQGLVTSSCTVDAANDNCVSNNFADAVNAIDEGITFANAFQTRSAGAVSGVYVAQRPLSLRAPGVTNPALNPGNGNAASVTWTSTVGGGSPPFVVSFPLDGTTGQPIATFNWNSGANDTTVTVTPVFVFECSGLSAVSECLPDDDTLPNYVGGAAALAQFFENGVPTLNLSRSNPTATFQFTNLPYPTQGGDTWRMYFEVRDAVTGATRYSYSAMPFLVIVVTPITIEFINFPPAEGTVYVTQPNPVDAYYYELRIARSPDALGLASVAIGYTVTPASALQFVVNGAPLTTNQFVFTGTQTVIHFQVIATTPVNNVVIEFTDPLDTDASDSFLNLPNDISFDILANPINIKVPNGPGQGPFVREPFQIEFTWTPPAAAAFTITITAPNGIEENSVTVNVRAGDTGAVSPAITPRFDTTSAPSADSYGLVLQLTSSSSAYSLPSIATVTVYRHKFVVTNAVNDNANLILFTSGTASRPYCISTNYPVFQSQYTTATDSLEIHFAAVDDEGRTVPGVIVEPTGNSTGGNNFVTLNKANGGWACVTLRADRLFNWDSLGLDSAGWSYNIHTFLGGSLSPMFQNPSAGGFVANDEAIWNFPHTVVVRRLRINTWTTASAFGLGTNTYALGETFTVFAYVDPLPPVGLQYFLKSVPAATIVPSNATLSGNAGINQQWHAWEVTLDNAYAGGTTTADDDTSFEISFTILVSGADAAFYRDSDPSAGVTALTEVFSVEVVKRQVEIYLPEARDEDGTLDLAVGESFDFTIALTHPVDEGLTVRLVAHTKDNGVASAGLSFEPASVTFTPGGSNGAVITVTGELLGTYEFSYELSGPDAEWFEAELYNSNGNSVSWEDWEAVEVSQRTAADLQDGQTIYAGVTYGPFSIGFPAPLLSNESVTITPWGGDFTFTPATFTLTPGQSQAVFSFVFRPQARVKQASVFWQVTGPSAWKYALPSYRTTYNVEYLDAEIVLQGGAVIPGVAHEGYVKLPFPADVTITPAVLGAAVSFSPASWNFTRATGNVIHFTYTVSATQTFGLATVGIVDGGSKRAATGDGAPDTTGTAIRIDFQLTGADSALFNMLTAGKTIAVIRPAFIVDATYGDAGTLSNANEQDNSMFVLGKWSQRYSIHMANAPTSAPVTLRITDTQQLVEFEFSSNNAVTRNTVATLTFSADNYVQYFRFRFVDLLSGDSTYAGIDRLSVSVSGPANAAVFDFTSIFDAFSGLVVVPALAFSPIPAIYTDGSATGLFVGVKDVDGSIGNGWPYQSNAQFTLHILPSLPEGVVVEPSTLEFSNAALAASDPVQSFTIRHTNPRVFAGLRSYTLTWVIRFAGSMATHDITSIVPQDAQNVLLSRYQIIPDFPHVLSYGWQDASFNLSFSPLAHVSFIPRLPPVDGAANANGGATPAGRVDFEPAVIVASPGQKIVNFKVKAQPGVDRDSLYYRVDWEIVGHEDDIVNLVESLQVNSTRGLVGENIHFATWHLASAGVTTVSFALVAFVCMIALARNMF